MIVRGKSAGKGEGQKKAAKRSLVRTRKAQKAQPGAPSPETRSRAILATMVREVASEPNDWTLPDVPAAVPVSDAAPDTAWDDPGEDTQALDDMPANDLAAIARHGGSLEIDGSKYTCGELTSLARNVTDGRAHLKINNSGAFSADELSAIARSKPGQVIFA